MDTAEFHFSCVTSKAPHTVNAGSQLKCHGHSETLEQLALRLLLTPVLLYWKL